ncbi:copper homeostasis membrane protein CopD [Labrys portucalensis]|uniref:Copper homeostasis membrane protein CopD n=1 Tax=Labrys neptuniae TaxID=376174 RepID=A0ABV6ZE07_9HYPH
MDLETALQACRFLHYAAAMVLFGASAFLAVLAPKELAGRLEARLRLLLMVAASLAATTTLAWLMLKTGEIGDGWADTLDPSLLASVLTDSSFGRAWQWRLAFAVCLPAAFLLGEHRLTAIACCSGLLLASLALTGHAAMLSGWSGLLQRGNHMLHLLAAGAWLGALIPLLPCLAMLGNVPPSASAGQALRRFSTAGHVAVSLVVVTGIANTAFVLGHPPADWSSPYQALLAAKIGLVGVMTALALTNRYFLVPRIRLARTRSLRLLGRLTVTELLLGAGVLVLVSLFGMIQPT